MPTRPARALVSILVLAVLTAAAAPAVAQRQGGQGQAGAARAAPSRSDHDRHRDSRALSAAVRRVERRTGGQVLSAERVPYEGRSLNRIKVVDATGRVRIYMDDPRNAPRAARERPSARGREPTRGDDN